MNRTSKAWWLMVPLIVVLLSFILPFTLLTNVDAWYGSFLLWTVVTAIVIGINAIISAHWED